MLKKTKIVALVLIALVVIIAIAVSSGPRQTNAAFHVTLADPSLYSNGVFVKSFEILPGKYQFNFVPNGDSPQKLSISLIGDNFSWNEEFELEGTPNKTGMSEYYTWDYIGQKFVVIEEAQKIEITIDPHQNLLGPVSVQLFKIEEGA